MVSELGLFRMASGSYIVFWDGLLTNLVSLFIEGGMEKCKPLGECDQWGGNEQCHTLKLLAILMNIP